MTTASAATATASSSSTASTRWLTFCEACRVFVEVLVPAVLKDAVDEKLFGAGLVDGGMASIDTGAGGMEADASVFVAAPLTRFVAVVRRNAGVVAAGDRRAAAVLKLREEKKGGMEIEDVTDGKGVVDAVDATDGKAGDFVDAENVVHAANVGEVVEEVKAEITDAPHAARAIPIEDAVGESEKQVVVDEKVKEEMKSDAVDTKKESKTEQGSMDLMGLSSRSADQLDASLYAE
ncbi:hypothetical protein HDU98_003755 [Podochytrium sp. JEL0797]|nr:hypothetical protein HDU98_003755 [Podochytrium sp. JEL0797]